MWARAARVAVQEQFESLRDADRAPAMAAYMKDVAPFLGIGAAARRKAQRVAWASLPPPDREQLLAGCEELQGMPEREYHYAATELLGRWLMLVKPPDLDAAVRRLLLTLPWWDTIDLWGSAVITPLVRRQPQLREVMWRWNGTDDQWLIRASIQHQRGLGAATDVSLLLALCEPHVADRRFWVAKGIGWALRDATQIDVAAVAGFVAAHPDLSAVARREATRGITRAMARDGQV